MTSRDRCGWEDEQDCSFSASTASIVSAKGCAALLSWSIILQLWFYLLHGDEMREKGLEQQKWLFLPWGANPWKTTIHHIHNNNKFQFDPRRSWKGRWSSVLNPAGEEKRLEEGWTEPGGQELAVHLVWATGIGLLGPWEHLSWSRTSWKRWDPPD